MTAARSTWKRTWGSAWSTGSLVRAPLLEVRTRVPHARCVERTGCVARTVDGDGAAAWQHARRVRFARRRDVDVHAAPVAQFEDEQVAVHGQHVTGEAMRAIGL